MRRREFLSLLGGAAAIWPLTARAQQPERMRRIGALIAGAAETDPQSRARVAALLEGFAQRGWTEGRNLRIDYRWVGTDPDSIRAVAAELVATAPEAIFAHSTPATTGVLQADRKSTRLNSSHSQISYAVFCLKKKNKCKIDISTIFEKILPCNTQNHILFLYPLDILGVLHRLACLQLSYRAAILVSPLCDASY